MSTNSTRVELLGEDTFARTAAAAADQLDDLDQAHQRAGELLLDRADPPRDTGALAESLYFETADNETRLTSDLDYFPFNAGFLAEDLAANESDVVDIFRDDIDRIAHTIKGA